MKDKTKYRLVVKLYNINNEYITDYIDYEYLDSETALLNYIFQYDLVVQNKSCLSKNVKSITLLENNLIVVYNNFEQNEFVR